jgi:hypothetical protein
LCAELLEADKVANSSDLQKALASANDKDFIDRPASQMSLTVPQGNLDPVHETLIWIKL